MSAERPPTNARRLSGSTAQIDALDGIRGVAVLLVLLSHMANLRPVPNVDFTGGGKSGVYLFFVLSAFLLTLGFLRKGVESLTWRELVVYALRRFLRIYPLFVIALALTCLQVSGLLHGRLPRFDASKFWANVTLQRGDGVFWTIGVEFKYYLLIPIVAFAHLILFRSRAILTAMLLIGAAAGAALAWRIPVDENLNVVRLAPFLPIFLAGTLGAVLFHARPQLSQPVRLGASLVATGAATSAALLLPSVLTALFGIRSAHQVIAHEVVMWAAIWSAMVLCVLVGAKLPRRLFETSWLRRAGQLCLGSYLLHPLIITAVRLAAPKLGIVNPYVEAWLILGAVFVCAELSLRLFERPLSDTSRIEAWARRPALGAEVAAPLADKPGVSL